MENSFQMTPELAEICGIHAGDGYLRNDGHRRELDISGNIGEQEYYDNHVVPLFERFFGITVNARFFPTRNTYGFVIRDKVVIEFLHYLGFPYGKKTLTVEVPSFILQSRDLDIIYGFIRGVFDTDGSISFRKRGGSGYSEVYLKRHTYPTITLAVCSRMLWFGICSLLKKTGFQFTVSYQKAIANESKKYSIAIRGDAAVINWIENIGFKNTLKSNRFLIWKNFGFVPPKLAFSDQKAVLDGLVNPHSYYPEKLENEAGVIPLLSKRRMLFVENFQSFIPND